LRPYLYPVDAGAYDNHVFIRHLQQGDNFRMQVLVFELMLRAYCIREKKQKPDTVSDSVLQMVRTVAVGVSPVD
jgi:hypothetical protein